MVIDYSPADEIATVFREEAAPIFAAHFHADTYEIKSLEWVSDGSGGRVETEVVKESGRCELRAVSARSGGEGVAGPYPTSEARLEAELPLDTILNTDHLLYVNGRKFGVSNVVRGGKAEMFTVAALDEEGV